jgi:lia operon protein LiaG
MYVLIRRLSLPLLLAFPLADAAAQTEQRALKGGHVAIYNLVGRVRAQATNGPDVTIAITRIGPDASRLGIRTATSGGREILSIAYPADRIVYRDMRGTRTRMSVRDDGTFSDGSWNDRSSRDDVEIRRDGSGFEGHADLAVGIPKGKKVELFLGVGRMDVSNVEGTIYIDVASAEVDVAGVRGILTLDTGSGRVSVRDVTGDVSVDAGSGGVSLDRIKGDVLTLDSGSGGVQATDVEVREMRADVGSGGLRMYRVKAPTAIVETGSGGTHLEFLSDLERLSVEAGSGGITVRAPATLNAEVSVETGSGGFQTDFEITTRRMGRDHVEGRIGAGKGRIDIEAGSGTVRLLKGTP